MDKIETGAQNTVRPLQAPERIFFTWTIHHSCNYRCPYCFITSDYKKTFLDNAYPGLEKLSSVWNRLYDIYGSCIIKFAGGEPFTYPGFMPLVKCLAQHHFLDISTNLFWDVADFTRSVPPRSARIEPSFHPRFCPDAGDFADKCLALKDHGFMGSVHLVGYPPYLAEIIGYKRFFENRGINAVILPFRGFYKDRSYPDSYSDEERKMLKSAAGRPDENSPAGPESEEKRHIRQVNARYFDWYVDKADRLAERQNRCCLMGAFYGKIQPNGDVLRCCTSIKDAAIRQKLFIGNIFDPDFRLFDKAKECDLSPCACWKPMLLGEDSKWKPLWNFESYNRPDPGNITGARNKR